jgi:GAF domain-containing protein
VPLRGAFVLIFQRGASRDAQIEAKNTACTVLARCWFRCFFRGLALCLTLLWAVPHAAWAQTWGQPTVASYGPHDYHHSAQTWAMAEDAQGVIYVGSVPGVAEFDGVRWRSIRSSSLGLHRALASDGKGRIYVAGRTDLGYLERDAVGNSVFTSLKHRLPPQEHGFEEIWNIVINSEGVYFNAGQAIYAFEPRSGTFTTWTAPPDRTFHMLFEVKGKIYVRQWGVGLLRLDSGQWTLLPQGERWAQERVYSLLPLDEKRLIMAVRGKGLYTFDGDQFQAFRTDIDALWPHLNVYWPGVVLPGGQLAYNTYGEGIYILDTQGRLLKHLDKSSGLRDSSVSALHVDRSGGLWAATANGVSRIDLGSPMTMLDGRHGVASSVLSLARQGDRLYIGSESGLASLKLGDRRVEPITAAGIQVMGLLVQGRDVLAAGDKGLFVVKGQTAETLVDNPNGTFFPRGLMASPRAPGLVWVGLTNGLGVLRRHASGQWAWHGRIREVTSEVTSMEEDGKGRLWVAGPTLGSVRLTFSSGADPLAVAQQQAFGKDRDWPDDGSLVRVGAELFSSSRNGLRRWDEGAQRWIPEKRFGPQASILFRHSADRAFLANDSHSHIQVLSRTGSDSGLQLEPNSTLRFAREEYINLVYADPDGRHLWLATSEGVVQIDEGSTQREDQQADEQSRTAALPVLLRAVGAGEQKLPLKPGLPPKLGSAARDLRFEWALPAYSHLDLNEYRSWLEGHEPTWEAWSRESSRKFTALAPGRYVFHVQARDARGHVGQTQGYAFEVIPPWYTTAWALLGCGSGLLALIVATVRWRTRRLNALVSARTAQLQERVEELAAVNRIGSALAAQLDPQALIALVGRQIQDLFKADMAYVALLDESGQFLSFPYYVGDDSFDPAEKLPLGQGLSSLIIQTGEPLLINHDFGRHVEALGVHIRGRAARSFLGVPVISQDRAIGVLSVQSFFESGRFDDDDIRLLKTIAAQVGISIRTASLYAQVRTLLDHVDQAIFSVDTRLQVKDECSLACEAVLGRRPAGQTLEQVLFPEDTAQAAHVRECLSDAASATDARRRDLFLSLVPGEIQLRGKTLKPQVVALDEGFMFAVSDHTAEKAMQAKLQAQRQGLEMVVAAVSDSVDFFQTVREFEQWVSAGAKPWQGRPMEELYRLVHTFKGSFAQLGFSQLPAALHEAEEALRPLLGQPADEAAQAFFQRDWVGPLERDLSVVSAALGAGFVRDGGVVSLSPADAPWVQQLARERLQAWPPGQAVPPGLLRLSHLLDISLQDELRAHERMLQRVAQQRGKLLEPLEVAGDEVWLEPERHRPWLAALSHVFRNAIDHGIELPEEREEAGKPEAGRIECRIALQGEVLELVIRDDGGGVNEAALREKVRQSHPDKADSLSLQEMMLMDGISSKDSADDVSGRGVGLSALHHELRALGGSIQIETWPRQGSRFTVKLPL